MDTQNNEICGFLDVKLVGNRYFTQKVRKKSLVPKVWKRFWCSTKKLAPGLGVQIRFESRLSCSNCTLKQNEKSNSVIIPPNAVIYRHCSKTKEFAFSISSGEDRKSLLSLSANSETETQHWMENIRYLLKSRRHYCIEKSYNVSIVDNAHSKTAGLTGLYGDLITSETGISIKNVHSGEIVENFEWKEFNQFHLMTAGRPEDVKRICVIHTTKAFRCGIGELYIFCLNAGKLLQDLVTQGRGRKPKQGLYNINDQTLRISMECNNITSPLHLENNAPSCILNTNINRISIKGIEAIKNLHQSKSANLIYNEEADFHHRRESNFSRTSAIYEEILDNVHSSEIKTITSNIYEDTDKVFYNLQMEPPPLPPRKRQKLEHIGNIKTIQINTGQYSPSKTCNPENKLQNTEVNIEENAFLENSSYVPMSQSRETKEYSKENDYEEITDISNDATII